MTNSYKIIFSIFRFFYFISILILGLCIFTGCGGGGESGGGGGIASYYDASGTYIYDSQILALNTTSLVVRGSAAPKDKKGIVNYNVRSLNGTFMTWDNPDGDDIVWSRTSGSADDIVGTWVLEDEEQEPIYTLTLDDQGYFQLSGTPPDDKFLFNGWGNSAGEPNSSATFDDYLGTWTGSLMTGFDDGEILNDQFTLTVWGSNSFVGEFDDGFIIYGKFSSGLWGNITYANPNCSDFDIITGTLYLQPNLTTMVITFYGYLCGKDGTSKLGSAMGIANKQ